MILRNATAPAGKRVRYKEREVRSLTDLLKALAQRQRTKDPVWFRGQARKSWKLRPSLARQAGWLEQEQLLTKRFKQNSFLLLPSRPQTESEWLFVMQHHGVWTRLLDWTESPLVGIYFAVNEAPKAAGALWALLPMELNRLANLPANGPSDLPSFEEDELLMKGYLPSALAEEQQSRLKTVAVIAPRNTARSQAQLAVFTIAHRDLTPIERLGNARHIWRYTIPANAKPKILKELENLHITRLTLFPELDNVGTYAKEIL